jgi:hypothetical protein
MGLDLITHTFSLFQNEVSRLVPESPRRQTTCTGSDRWCRPWPNTGLRPGPAAAPPLHGRRRLGSGDLQGSWLRLGGCRSRNRLPYSAACA